MRITSSSLLVAASLALALALTPARDASACGGCFHEDIQQMESTVVTGHRMIISISKTQTTLWDQFEYSGAPQNFAWVLPIKGQVDYDVSSDALFETLEQRTQVSVKSPNIVCPPPPSCGFGSSASSSSSGSGGGGVTVIAEKTVGPFDVKQLSSADPQALTTWLVMNGYAIPADITPLIAAYVAEGFDFLAVKLSSDPNITTHSMKPFRVTTQGGNPVLPLRMVAAGAGALVPITLWIVSEGAYVPANFPYFAIAESDLVWDWSSMSSNYKDLRQAGYDATQGEAWLLEASEPLWKFDVIAPIQSTVTFAPAESGYGDDMGVGAQMAFDADMATLFAGIADGSAWVGRIRAELPRAALAADLQMMASPNQSAIQRSFTAQKTIGTPPMCPMDPPCRDSTSSGSSGGPGGVGSGGAGGSADQPGSCSGDCAVGSSQEGATPLGIGALALVAMAALSRRAGRARRTRRTRHTQNRDQENQPYAGRARTSARRRLFDWRSL